MLALISNHFWKILRHWLTRRIVGLFSFYLQVEDKNPYILPYSTIYMEVKKVFTTLDLTADEHFETYRIWLDFAEIVEKYK